MGNWWTGHSNTIHPPYEAHNGVRVVNKEQMDMATKSKYFAPHRSANWPAGICVMMYPQKKLLSTRDLADSSQSKSW